MNEVLTAARKVTGHPIPVAYGPRREGDPAELVASSARIGEELGWVPRYAGIEEILASAWDWMQRHPLGWPA